MCGGEEDLRLKIAGDCPLLHCNDTIKKGNKKFI